MNFITKGLSVEKFWNLTIQVYVKFTHQGQSTGYSLPFHNKNLPIPTPPNLTLLILSTSRRTRAVVLRTRAVVLKNEVDLGETRTPPAVVNIYSYS